MNTSALQFGSGIVLAQNNIFANYLVGIDSTGSGSSGNEDYNDFFNAPSAGVTNGGHSISGDPKFRDPANGDFHLAGNSPAIDSGDNSALPVDLTTDLDGLARREDIVGVPDTGVGPAPVVDMGAYELHNSDDFPKRIRIADIAVCETQAGKLALNRQVGDRGA